jgi:hypothetical protein
MAVMEEKIENLHKQNQEIVSKNNMVMLKNEALTSKILSMRHKKNFYKNSVLK